MASNITIKPIILFNNLPFYAVLKYNPYLSIITSVKLLNIKM